MSDPLADSLTRIRNAQAAGKTTVKFPYSKMNFEVATILSQEKFIESVDKKGRGPKRYLECTLRYHDGVGAITALRRVSTPARHVYQRARKIKPSTGGEGIFIVSTSQGIMTDNEARKRRLGGEVMCEIW